jgi:DNA-binding winged helix-turn-helix (wHTH) protein/tetratricopeptide (TPR) repeat protein
MAHGGQPAQSVRFGPYEMDLHACEIRCAGRRIQLQIQPFRVLAALVGRAGEVVTRAELRDEIWPSRVHVDFDHGLNNAVNRLRQVLGDSSASPRFIETLPRIGYRFIHVVEHQSGLRREASTTRPSTRKLAVTVAGLILAVLGGFAVYTSRQDRVVADPGDLSPPLTHDSEAWDAYLRGVGFFERRNKEAVTRSIEYLTRATALDPEFAEAYAALAEAYVTAGGPTLARSMLAEDAGPLALEAAQQALWLEPDLAEGHSALASVLDKLQPWSPENDARIEAEYSKAIALGPSASRAHLFFGNFLSSRGRSNEAILQYRQALESEPLSPSINSRLGAELVAAGEIDRGMGFLSRTVELDPYQYNARVRLGWAYAALGRLDEAREEFSRAEAISPASLPSLSGLAFVAALHGELELSREKLDAIIPMAQKVGDPFSVAIVYVGLRDREHALEWLTDTARKSRNLHRKGPYGIGSPFYDWLRNDPGFREVERAVMEQSNAGPPLAD